MTDQELKDLVASLAVQNKESGERFDREMKESREKFDREVAEWNAGMTKLQEQIKEISQQIGGISDSNGKFSEQFFQSIYKRTKEFCGMKFDDFVPNLAHKTRNEGIEFDIAMFNGNSVALIEVKYNVRFDFIEEFATNRVKAFRKFYPEYDNYKVYLGIASLSIDKRITNEAKKWGVALIKQKGENVEIESDLLKSY